MLTRQSGPLSHQAMIVKLDYEIKNLLYALACLKDHTYRELGEDDGKDLDALFITINKLVSTRQTELANVYKDYVNGLT